MATLLEKETETTAKPSDRTPARPADDRAIVDQIQGRNAEIDELLRIKLSRRIDGTRVPCPSCNIVIENTLNQCPFCESDVTAATALARETTRRLRELSGELDAEHASRTKEKPKRRSFFERLKYLFEGDPEPVESPRMDPNAKRLLSSLAAGDTLKVIEEDGPWVMVKTMSSVTGWVYSTVRKHS